MEYSRLPQPGPVLTSPGAASHIEQPTRIKVRGQGSKDQSRVRRLFGRKPSRPSTPPLSIIVLNRMAFGPRPGDLESFAVLGNSEDERFEAYVEQQLDPGSIDDSDLDSRLAGFPTLQKSVSQLWTDHLLGAGGDYLIQRQPFHESEAAVFVRAVHSKRQLIQVLSDFWFNHFNVFPEDVLVTSVFSHYEQDVIRANVLGNFREMLEVVATSPAMLFYLDNVASRNSGRNENFSRELFELHTMGAENYLGVGLHSEVPRDEAGNPIGYVDADVFEATRCFTGWSFDEDIGVFLYRSDWHDRFQKNVLGQFFPQDQPPLQDGRDVLDVLAAHPGTARHIARKLCRRLVSDSPSARLVEETAVVFAAAKDDSDQLAQAVRSILLSSEFRNTWGGKVKRPFEVISSFLRALGADLNLLSTSHPDFRDDPVSTGLKYLMAQTGNAPLVGRRRMVIRIHSKTGLEPRL